VSEGGDPACWADRVCRACGLLDERERRDTRCPHCGATDGDPGDERDGDPGGTNPPNPEAIGVARRFRRS
jgi:hypothetical protein